MIRVLLVDDHAIVRAGVRALLAAEGDFVVVAEAGDGRAGLEAAVLHKPDVVLLDLSMPGANGLDAVREIVRRAPTVRVVVLTMHPTPEYVRPALAAGAHGYVVKGAGLDDLVTALRVVAGGGRFLGPEAERVQRSDALSPTADGAGGLDLLTPRERQVLQRVAEGQTNRDIAAALGLSPKTVDTHRTRLMQKLDIHDAASLTRFAIRHRLVGE